MLQFPVNPSGALFGNRSWRQGNAFLGVWVDRCSDPCLFPFTGSLENCGSANTAGYRGRSQSGESPRRSKNFRSVGRGEFLIWTGLFWADAFRRMKVQGSVLYRRFAPGSGAFPEASKPTAWPVVGRGEVASAFPPRTTPHRRARPNPPPMPMKLTDEPYELDNLTVAGSERDAKPTRPANPKASKDPTFRFRFPPNSDGLAILNCRFPDN
jgi:hypothetical protein